MNASSSKALVIGLGGLGLLFVVAAANRQKRAAESDPELTPPGPPPPIRLPPGTSTQPPAIVLPTPELTPAVTQVPVTLDPMVEPPGPPIPLQQPPSLDPMVEPPGPPIPLQPPPSSMPSMPTFPVTVPPTATPVKRPFGDQPLDVEATRSNIAPPKAAAATPPAKRSANQAALDLLAYVTPILAAKRGAELGVKGAPNGVVKAAQLDMGDVPADGIYGPRTRAKGTALSGKKFPPRV
jgi:hypothetical protein